MTFTGMDVKRHGLWTKAKPVPTTKAQAKAWLKALANSPLAFHLDDPTDDIPSFAPIAARLLGRARDAAMRLLGTRMAWSYYDWHLTRARKMPPKTNPVERTMKRNPMQKKTQWTSLPYTMTWDSGGVLRRKESKAYVLTLPDGRVLEVVPDAEYGWIASIDGLNLGRPYRTAKAAQDAVLKGSRSRANPVERTMKKNPNVDPSWMSDQGIARDLIKMYKQWKKEAQTHRPRYREEDAMKRKIVSLWGDDQEAHVESALMRGSATDLWHEVARNRPVANKYFVTLWGMGYRPPGHKNNPVERTMKKNPKGLMITDIEHMFPFAWVDKRKGSWYIVLTKRDGSRELYRRFSSKAQAQAVADVVNEAKEKTHKTRTAMRNPARTDWLGRPLLGARQLTSRQQYKRCLSKCVDSCKRTTPVKKNPRRTPVSKKCAIPKGKRHGDTFTRSGQQFQVISYTTADGKRVRYARKAH